MSTTPNTPAQTDLMDEFRANRFAQIENLSERVAELDAAVERGELRKRNDGRYVVLPSDTGMGRWDAGEILSDQGMPEHGLDLSQDGVTPAFYSTNARPWWGLGNHLEEGLYSAKAACMAADQDWEILKRRARFLFDDEAEVSEENPLLDGDEDMFMTVRSDTKAALGMVGRVWTSIHNRDAFAFMEEFGQPFETVGSFRGGRRVFATMALPEDMTVDVAGINETIKLYVAAINHHDGNGGLNLFVTPYRIECGNTERLGINGAVTSWKIKHTKNHQDKLAEAQKSLRLVHRYAEAWTRDENKLAATAITATDVSKVIADLNREIWGADDEDGTRKVNKLEARVTDIMNRWAVENERCGQTAYALERALTGHLDHAGERRPRKDLKAATPLAVLGAAILEDTDGAKKTTVHKRMMELVRR